MTINTAAKWTLPALLLSIAGCATFFPAEPEARRSLAEAAILSWYAPCRLTAVKLLEDYGPPDQVRPDRLVWNDRHPWKRIVVRDGELTDEDSLEQTLSYMVPDDRREAMAGFAARVSVGRFGTDLTARSSSEARNLLALNLAHRIVIGRLDAAEARMLYGLRVELAAAGKTFPEMQRLLFLPEP